MKKLQVHYEGWGEKWHLGTLADDGRQLLFEYSAEARQRGLELSPLHMPLRPLAYGDFPAYLFRLPGFIADALPDGWGLMLMDRVFRKNGLNPASLSPLDRLAFIGGRAMGALSFEPADDQSMSPADISLLELAEQARAVVMDKDDAALRILALMGGSPQGARPKVLVHFDPASQTIGTHPFGQSTPWLVKFQAQGEHKEVCAIENLYAELARSYGIDMPSTRYFDLGPKLAAFGIERFDVASGMRVPILTLAGALHVDFRVPSTVDYLGFLRLTQFVTKSAAELDKAYARAVFNVVFHNRDDHAKNFSFRLGQNQSWYLAPGYDLTFSEGPGGEHQMDVCGWGTDIGRAQMLELARKSGVTQSNACDAIDKAASLAQTLLVTGQDHAIRTSTLKRIAANVVANAKLLS